MTALAFGSLFTGIGGFDLGFERAGMSCAWQCENDSAASLVLARHWPHVYNTGDVHNVTRDNHAPVDLICGGFPCQDVSIAGKRAGLAGERSGLWFEFHRIIAEFGPQWVVIENVPGLLSSNGGRDFAVILRGLVECGYGVAWRILDAQYFGVAQRRRRVFIVGSLGDGRAAEILFESEGVFGNPAARRTVGQDVAYSLRSNPSHSGDKGDGGVNTTLIADTLTAQYANNRGAQAGNSCKTSNLYVMAGQANAEIVSDGVPSLTTNHEAPILFSARHGTESDISHTLTVSTMPYFFDRQKSAGESDIGARRLTPVECERLQGFPDGWTAGQADKPRYRQLGNAVAVPVAKWIGERIVSLSQ